MSILGREEKQSTRRKTEKPCKRRKNQLLCVNKFVKLTVLSQTCHRKSFIPGLKEGHPVQQRQMIYYACFWATF